MNLVKYIFSGWLILVASISFASNKLVNVRMTNTPQKTSLLLQFAHKPVYKQHRLKFPERIWYEFNCEDSSKVLNNLDVTGTNIEKVQAFMRNGKLRIVFYLPAEVNLQQQLNDTTLTIEFMNSRLGKHATIVTIAAAKPKEVFTIVLDAGHGGFDPGAVSANGSKEKDITLAVVKLLQQQLATEPNIKVKLTRSSDNFIKVRKRLEYARTVSADLFVSIHADGFNDERCHGASVYVLSDKGASNEAARWIAAHENYNVLANNIEMHDKEAPLRKFLYDLSQQQNQMASEQLATQILAFVRKMTKLHSSKVESGPFAVLRSPDIPSVLIELGFISNCQEASKLQQPKQQLQYAKAIKQGIMQYIKANFTISPPK